jgi:hypothetical protein
MGRYQFTAVTLSSLAFIIYMDCSASSGWLGPSSYDECVLDKTNDRMLSNYQVFTIQQACRNLFPPEPKETLLDESGKLIQYKYCSDTTGDAKICVTGQPDIYTITRVVGHFAIKNQCAYLPEQPPREITEMCDPFDGTSIREYRVAYEANQSTFTSVVGSKSWLKDIYSFHIQPNFNCSYFSFYGIYTQ